jgi:hypothetical protein
MTTEMRTRIHYGHHDHRRDFGIGLMTMTRLLLSGIYKTPYAPSVHGLERESLRQLLRDFSNFQWSLRSAGFRSDTVSFKFDLICMPNELEVKCKANVLTYSFIRRAGTPIKIPHPALLLSNLDHAKTKGRERGDATMLRIQPEQLRSEATIGGLGRCGQLL